MDALKRSHFLEELTGSIFLSEFEAMRSLDSSTFLQPAGDGERAKAASIAE